jgi:hypothetical protein
MSEETPNNDIPELGMAAAAFACLLVAVSIEHPSAELLEAVRIFAVTIPLVVAGVFVRMLRRNVTKPWLRKGFLILRLGCILVGDVGCGIGIYWMFRHVSNVAADRFLATSLISWIVVGFLGMIAGAAGFAQPKKPE